LAARDVEWILSVLESTAAEDEFTGKLCDIARRTMIDEVL